jgi:hypothetical protein
MEPPRRVCIDSGRTGRFKATGTALGHAVVGAGARATKALLVVREQSSTVFSFELDSGGAGKDAYSCMTLSSVGDGVERTESGTERSRSLCTLELGVSAREASNIFAPRTIG